MQLYPYHENNRLLSQKETYNTFLLFYAGKYDRQYFGNKRQLDNKNMKYENLFLYVFSN